MALRLQMRPSGVLIPIEEFSLKGVAPGELILGEDIPYVAALNLGHDGRQPRLLQLDSAKNLKVVQGVAAPVGPMRLQDGAGALLATVIVPADGTGSGNALSVWANPALWVGVANSMDMGRAARAALMASKTGQGVQQTTPPGNSVANSAPAAGIAPSASIAAGGAGIRNVCTGWKFVMSSQAALAAVATVTLNIRDGASGAGGILESFNIDLPAAVIAPFTMIASGLSLVGSAATAMTIELAAAVAGLRASVSLTAYSAT